MYQNVYYDKEQKYHNLIQSISRTNRVLNANKRYGNIICFRPIKEDLDDALELFSDPNAEMNYLKPDYDKCLVEYVNNVNLLMETFDLFCEKVKEI